MSLELGSQGIGLAAIKCPEAPEQTSRDYDAEISGDIAKFRRLLGLELKGQATSVAKDLLGKLPGADRVYMEQMMYATFCSSLNEDKTLSDSERRKELKEYNSDVRKAFKHETSPSKQPGKEKGRGSPSDSAREALARLGVGWTSDSFADAIIRGDIRSVALFLDGGMTPDLNHKGASMALYALQPAAANRSEVLKLFLVRGMDPNKNLLDTRIMPSYGSLPPHFDEAPVGYGAWNKTFVGPADLWIVIRGSYTGPADGDFDLLRQLAAKGATMRTSLLFLKSYEPIWGDMPAYRDVRRMVESLKGIAPSLPVPDAAPVAPPHHRAETCGPSLTTTIKPAIFVPQWVPVLNRMREERNIHDIINLMSVWGRTPVGREGTELIDEALFALNCLEKQGQLKMEKLDPPSFIGLVENKRIIFLKPLMTIPE